MMPYGMPHVGMPRPPGPRPPRVPRPPRRKPPAPRKGYCPHCGLSVTPAVGSPMHQAQAAPPGGPGLGAVGVMAGNDSAPPAGGPPGDAGGY